MKLITKIRRLFGRKKGKARQVRESKALVDGGTSSATRVPPPTSPLVEASVEEKQDAPLFPDVPTTSDEPPPATSTVTSSPDGASICDLSSLRLLPFFCELEPKAEACTQQDDDDLPPPVSNVNGQSFTGRNFHSSPPIHGPAGNPDVKGKASDVNWDFLQVEDEDRTATPDVEESPTMAAVLDTPPFRDYPLVLEDIEGEASDAARTSPEDEDPSTDVFARYPTRIIHVYNFSVSSSSRHSAEMEDTEAQVQPRKLPTLSVHFKNSTEGATSSQAIHVPADATDSPSVYSYREEIPSVTLGDSLGSAAAMPQTPYPRMHESFSAAEEDDPIGDDDLVTSDPISPVSTRRSHSSNYGIPSTVELKLPTTGATYDLFPHQDATDSAFGSLYYGKPRDEEGETIAVKVINKKEIRYLKTYVDDDCRKPRIVFRNEEDARTWARTLHPQKYKHEGKEMTTLTSLRAELKALKRIRDTSSDFAGGFLDVVQDGNYIYMAMPFYEQIYPPEIKGGWLWIRRVVAQAVLGVESLHKNGIVHRDIKPSNFMQTCESGPGGCPRLRIIDFGLSTVVDEENPKDIYISGWSGTEGFVPPEITESDDWDKGVFSGTKTDIFALGISILATLCVTLEVPMTMARDAEAPKLEGDKHFDLPKIMLKVQSKVGKMNDGCWTKETGLLLDLIGHMTHWNWKTRFGFRQVKAHKYLNRENILDEALRIGADPVEK